MTEHPTLQFELEAGGTFAIYAPPNMTQADWKRLQGMCGALAGDWVKFTDNTVEARP